MGFFPGFPSGEGTFGVASGPGPVGGLCFEFVNSIILYYREEIPGFDTNFISFVEFDS